MDYELKLFDQLLQFPLFQGLSRAELQQMAGNTKFGFLKLQAHKKLVGEGETCRQLFFLVSGQLELTTVSDDGSYRVTERLAAPYLVQPEALFGLHQQFSHHIRTLAPSHFITLTKDEVLRLIDDFLIFRLNLMGLLATQSQRLHHRPWRRCPQSLEERVVRFFIDHCVYPAGPKTFHILMRQLASEVGDSRLDVSRVLNELQQRSLLSLHRGCIKIPYLEHLLM